MTRNGEALRLPNSVNSCVGRSKGPQDSVPEKIDHRKISVGVSVVNKMKRLLSSEPGKSLKLRAISMIFLVKKDVRIERYSAGNNLNEKQIKRQYEISARPRQKHWDEKEGRIIAFVTQVGLRDEMILGIIGVMKVDVISKELSAQGTMAKSVVQKGLPERYHQVRTDRSREN
jgi:hypothetical protein